MNRSTWFWSALTNHLIISAWTATFADLAKHAQIISCYSALMITMQSNIKSWVRQDCLQMPFWGASQFVPMSSRTMPTRTQVNSYPLPTRTYATSYPIPSRTQVISYPIPTRTQLVPKSQLTRTQRRTYRLVALVWHTNWSQPILHSMESFCKLYNLSRLTHNC